MRAERAVWIVAGLLVLAPLVGKLLADKPVLLGTNNVRALSPLADVQVGQALCAAGLEVPAGTREVVLRLDAGGAAVPPMTATLRSGDATIGAASPAGPAGPPSDIALVLEEPLGERLSDAELCVEGAGLYRPWGAGGSVNLAPAPEVAGRPLEARLALRYRRSAAHTASVLSLWPDMMERAGRFRPDPLGTWSAWLLLAAGVPLSILGALLLVARASRLAWRRVLIGVVACALVQGLAWGMTTPLFDGPDEPDHFAYTEALAEAGHVPDRHPGARPAFSDAEGALAIGVGHAARIGAGDGKAIYTDTDERRYAEAARGKDRGNGGGYTIPAHAHGPAYYALTVPAYQAAGSETGALHAGRLVSVLLFALIALSAAGVMRELVPGRPELAAATGAVVALQPVLGFIGGVLNNDNGLNAAAALLVWGLVRSMRRPPTLPLALGVGALIAVLPMIKGSGLTFWPLALLALVVVALRHRRGAAVPLAGALGVWVVAAGAYAALAPEFGRALLDSPDNFVPLGEQLRRPGVVLPYLWQTVGPPLGQTDLFLGYWPLLEVYVREAFGGFGWLSFVIRRRTAVVILLALVVLALAGLLAAWQRRDRMWGFAPEALLLLGVAVAVVAGVQAVFATDIPKSVPPEQGRYAFPAAVPVAVLLMAGTLALPRRWSVAACALLVAAMAGLNVGGRLLYLTGVYT